MRIFGFNIERSKDEKSLAASGEYVRNDIQETGAVEAAGHYGYQFDMANIGANEGDLLRRYRETADYPDCDMAIEEICNEAITSDHTNSSVEIVLEDIDFLTNKITEKIREEFDQVLRLLKFQEHGYDLFKRWYVDGKIYHHIVIDPENIKDGIQELRFIEPLKIRRIKRQEKALPDGRVTYKELYVYNDKGVNDKKISGVELTKDSVIEVTSGLYDPETRLVKSYLHKAIKPVNMLKMVEDSLVIYRLSRAPERRVFYVDVGNLPKQKAEQYVKSIMDKYRNKIVYDVSTGEVKNKRHHMSMLEDFWMPRREGGKGTEITTLQGGDGLSNIDDVTVLQNKVYRSMNVPLSRLEPQQGFSLGRSTEISRDEIKFSKFIGRLRVKFSKLFKEALKVQLIAKGILDLEEWERVEEFIRFDFMEDNHFEEFKQNEIMMQRADLLQRLEMFVGTYYSKEWISKNVLMLSEEEFKEMQAQIKKEPKPDPEQSGGRRW